MADADYDLIGDGFHRNPASPRMTGAKVQRYVNLAGGLVSLALVVGLGVWGYRLAVRDVRGVPVIQALDGPMRIAPADPGGEVADHQGLAVNDVAAVGVASPMPEQLVLAPRPVELAPDDLAGLGRAMISDATLAMAPGEPVTEAQDLSLAAAPLVESANPTEVAVDAALAEALGETVPENALTENALPEAFAEPAPEGAITRSPRPVARPTTRPLPAPTEATAVATPDEIDPATIPVGTRLVQFGAFDTADEARAEWVRLSGQFGELMAGKRLVLQPAESGGRTFHRLRAHGFADEADARRFCSAFVALNATCIPVPQR